MKLKFYADPEAALITIKSLAAARYKQYRQDFDSTLKEYFVEIKKRGTKNLIIDLHGNEGGSYSPEKLYSYISQGKKLSADDHRHTMGIKPAKNAFVGEVMVLTNEKSISALESFVSIFKYYDRGITVGASTPGCYKGLCGGKKYHLVLPNSGFEISIPMHKGVYKNTSGVNYIEGQGYPPDFKVGEKIEDLLKGRDTALEFALDEIRNE